MSRSSDSEKTKDTLRITNQFRQKKSMVYDLRGDGCRLTLSIRPRESENDPGEYCVEARNGTGDDATILSEWGGSKADALKAVGVVWATHPELATFDWAAVERALLDVRAV